MHHVLDEPRPCHRLEVGARLAQFDAEALDATDAEALADEVVEPHAAGRHLTACRSGLESCALDLLGLDESQRLAGLRAVGEEVAVTLEPLAGDGDSRLGRRERPCLLGPEMDRLDRHGANLAAREPSSHSESEPAGTRAPAGRPGAAQQRDLIERSVYAIISLVTPRRYDMSTRSAAAEETRRRILEATLELHTQKGIFGTSWQDIARHADVSVGTVYRHFPSLAELVPACGELLFELTGPPSPQDATAVIGDEPDPVRRLELAASFLFAFYERAGKHIDSDARERELPEVREWEEYLRATVTAFVREALAPRRLDARQLQLVSALFDFRTYDALRTRGISAKRVARELGELIGCRLGLEGPSVPRPRTRTGGHG